MRNYTAKRREITLRQSLNRLSPVNVLAVMEAALQLPVAHARFNFKQVAARRHTAARRTGRLRRYAEAGVGVQNAIELAQVIENHLRLVEFTQALCVHVFAQLAQHAVADAMTGYGPRLLLRPLQALADVASFIQLQSERVGGREPAERPRKINVGNALFPPMTFHLDQQVWPVHPAPEGFGQRRQ